MQENSKCQRSGEGGGPGVFSCNIEKGNCFKHLHQFIDDPKIDDGEEIHMMVIITRMVIKWLLFSVSVSTVLSAIMALMSFQ